MATILSYFVRKSEAFHVITDFDWNLIFFCFSCKKVGEFGQP